MKEQKVIDLRLRVENEQDLYTPFSPDDEFNENVKAYIRSKLVAERRGQPINMTVVSSSPLDEERFRSAVANWVRDEIAVYQQEARRKKQLPTVMFTVGALIIILVTVLKQFIEPITFAIILIIGTAVLSKGVTNWYEQVPTIKIRNWLTSELKKTSKIIFVCEDDQSVPDAGTDEM